MLKRQLRNIWIKRTGAAALAALVLTLGVLASASASAWASPTYQTNGDMDQLKAESGKQFESDFLNMMIEHHQSALDMAKLVPDRAAHQELKAAAQKIITDQTREISEMTGWLQSWYNETPKKGMMHDMPGMGMADMMSLQNLKGDAFDKQFLTMMRMHHMGAVEMAQLVPNRATHEELKTLGQNIISSQSSEIKEFEGWMKTWFNVDAAGMGTMGSMGSMSGGSTTPPDTTSGSTGGAMGGSMSGSSSGSMPQTGAGDSVRGGLLALVLVALVAVAAGTTLLFGGAWLRKRT